MIKTKKNPLISSVTIQTNKNLSTFYKNTPNPILDLGEISYTKLPDNTRIYDIIYGYDLSEIKSAPIQIIKIGNGKQAFDELRSIILLDNGDYIISDNDGNIIEYITNSTDAAPKIYPISM